MSDILLPLITEPSGNPFPSRVAEVITLSNWSEYVARVPCFVLAVVLDSFESSGPFESIIGVIVLVGSIE